MQTDQYRGVGTCPDCSVAIPAGNVLIEYERLDGQVAIYAACPECGVPVHPESTG